MLLRIGGEVLLIYHTRVLLSTFSLLGARFPLSTGLCVVPNSIKISLTRIGIRVKGLVYLGL